MKEFDPGDNAASIVSVTDRVRPLAIGMPGFLIVPNDHHRLDARIGQPRARDADGTAALLLAWILLYAAADPHTHWGSFYGNAINVMRTAVEFERAGAAGICIEDNEFPKRCSFYEGVRRELAGRAISRARFRGSRPSDIEAVEVAVVARPVPDHAHALERAEHAAIRGAESMIANRSMSVSNVQRDS